MDYGKEFKKYALGEGISSMNLHYYNQQLESYKNINENIIKYYNDYSKQTHQHETGSYLRGAYSYIVKPSGAKKLIDWSYKNGVTSADVMVGDKVLDIAFDDNKLISFNPKQQSDKNGYTPFSTSKTMMF